MIRFGDIRPIGWAREELEENMNGCIGNLDRLVPDLILEHDIYNTTKWAIVVTVNIYNHFCVFIS